MMSSDAGLIEGLRGPDAERAASALYRIYGAELYGFARHRLGDAGLAEELVQDVFTRIWQSAARYDPARGSVRTWLYAIATNAIRDLERRRGRRPPMAFAGSRDADSPDDARRDGFQTALLRYQIQLAVSRLTFAHRQVISLIHFRGLSIAEVAELTGLPLGTVKSRLYYASQNLRLALEELEVLR